MVLSLLVLLGHCFSPWFPWLLLLCARLQEELPRYIFSLVVKVTVAVSDNDGHIEHAHSCSTITPVATCWLPSPRSSSGVSWCSPRLRFLDCCKTTLVPFSAGLASVGEKVIDSETQTQTQPVLSLSLSSLNLRLDVPPEVIAVVVVETAIEAAAFVDRSNFSLISFKTFQTFPSSARLAGLDGTVSVPLPAPVDLRQSLSFLTHVKQPLRASSAI
mmetsp:Transcript_12297/g.24615  ORF Transcript_12297/g.24615 Transcript_12297/m.24615 type:complete len:216 (-) Transcript_12297:299-946(-)